MVLSDVIVIVIAQTSYRLATQRVHHKSFIVVVSLFNKFFLIQLQYSSVNYVVLTYQSDFYEADFRGSKWNGAFC